VHEILKPLLLRRNKNDKLENGKPILDLPPKDIKLRKLEFSDEEREVRLSIFVTLVQVSSSSWTVVI
jgi:DNA repair protein RAD5